jgi:hypothetical protein
MNKKIKQCDLPERDIMLAIIERHIKIYPRHFFAHKNKVLDKLTEEQKEEPMTPNNSPVTSPKITKK